MNMDHRTILVTGGSGFIGSNFVHFVLDRYPGVQVLNLDKLTYAGNPENLRDVEEDPRYHFIKGDIRDAVVVEEIFVDHAPDILVNFAAESHVDRSIGDPDEFIRTDVFGAYRLLEAARKFGIGKFIQISTDEVYGSIESGTFSEGDQLRPTNPYAASKAGADRLAYSYARTYEMPVIISRASNNFGPCQYPEKLIPLFVTNAIDEQPLPLYGDGKNVRDWLHVEDHCHAVCFLIEHGADGEAYNVAAGNERENIGITQMILSALGKAESLIAPVKDRQAHDRRYALDWTKIHDLGWSPQYTGEAGFRKGLEQTIQWYQEHEAWWRPLKSGEFLEYYKRHYQIDLSNN